METTAEKRGATVSERDKERAHELALEQIRCGASGASGLTLEDRAKLRAPFASSAVRWLPIAGMIYGKQQFMPHINASLVFERLAEVDPAWSLDRVEPEASTADDPLGLKFGAPHRAWITVNGVQRSGRGAVAPNTTIDDKLLKSIESDAIKRAALAFEIGAYLRAFETVFLPQTVNGAETFKSKKGKDRNGKDVEKFSYLTAHGKAQLAGHYDRVMASAVFAERYGKPVEYGDAAVAGDGSLADEEAMTASESAAQEPQAKGVELEVLVLLSRYDGRATSEDVIRDTLMQHPFAKLLPRKLNSVKAHLMVDPEDAERLRQAAIRAVESDGEAIGELEDALDQLQALAETKQSSDDTQETMPV